MDRRRPALLALVLLALAYASLPQGIGWNQNSHYALTRALADGTPIVDRHREETGDVAWVDGHYYSTKATGLAFVTLPVYLALDGTGALDLMARLPGLADETVGALWALGLVGCVLPAVLVLELVRRLAELLAPGYGTAAAVVLGAGTLLLPFATLFFNHVLSAALGFGAFGVLWLSRERGTLTTPAAAVGSGLLAGLAVVAHYSLAIVAVIVGLYALATSSRVRNGLLYGAGALAGIAPLLAYNWWAFGSPSHLSYRGAVLVGGSSGHDVLGANASGFFGIGAPSLATVDDLLFGSVGLLTLAPVLAPAAVGTVLLYRRRRAEALVVAAVALAFLVSNAGYVDPFGGFSPGPRFLVPVLPFLGVPLALALRRFPVATVALGAISIAVMVAVTVTQPLLAYDGRWLERVENGSFGSHGIALAWPLAILVLAAVGLASGATPRPAFSRSQALTAVAATGAWLLVFLTAPAVDDDALVDRVVATTEVLAAAALAALVAVAFHVVVARTLSTQVPRSSRAVRG